MNKLRLLLVAVGAAAAAAVLWRLGLAGSVEVDWSDPIGWLSAADPLDAILVVLAGAGFLLCVYLAVVSGLSFLAGGLRLGWLTRFVNRLTVPPLRRLLRLGVVGGVLASTVGSTIMAAPAGGAPNLRHASMTATESDAAVASASSAGQAAAPLSGVAPTRPATVDASAVWTVAEGQSWWSISKATMGRGELWQELQRVNVGREVAPGIVMSDKTALAPGMVLAVPKVPAPEPVDVSSGAWIVQPGDTLARIATQVYGDRAEWVRVWEANGGRSFAGRTFSNPNVLGVGWELNLPGIAPEATPARPTAAPPAAAVEPPAPSTVSVERGDTLAVIARRVYGDGTRWPTIWEANQGRDMGAGRVFADPDQLDVGWQLVVPPLPTPVPAPVAAAPASHTVAPGDTLWDIAGGHYGREDPALVGMVFAANRGVTDPDGRTLHDPDLINPGMQLTLPADPTAAVPPAPSTVSLPLSPVPAPVATPVPPPSAAPSPPPADLTPMTPTEVPSSPAVSTPPTTAPELPAPVDLGVLPAATATGADSPEESAPSRFEGGLAAATLLATGALTLVDARRRRQLQRMGQNDVLPMPDPDLAPTQAAMRAGSDAVGIARLDIALRALAARAASRDPNAEAVRPELVVRHGSGRIEVHLQRVPSGDPPEPWVAEDPRVWVLPPAVPTADLVAAAQDVPPPCPALVMLGRSGPAEIYLDLEAAGILRLDGPPEHVVALARALVASLAVSPLADVVQVVSTGVDVYGFANEERVDAVGDPSEALGLAQAATGSTRAVMDEQHVASTFALRASARSEPWEPTMVLLLRSTMKPSQVADLAGLVGEGGRGLAVVTDQPVSTARWHLSIAEGRRWRLEPVGLTLEPIALAADELADLGALLHDAKLAPVTRAAPPPPVAPWGPPAVSGTAPAPTLDARPVPEPDMASGEPFVEPDWAVQVRIMGPVEVVNPKGKVARFERSRSLELVVWVAQHPTNASRVAARTAIWESDVRDTSFNNVVSEARRALASLGLPPDGDEWLPKSATDRLTLNPLVVTDVDLIRARYEHARHQPDHLAIDILRDALEMVRDVPYAGTNWLWPDGEGLPSNLTLLAVNAATEMAQRCLQTGDIDAVFWATSLGLRVLPGHDELVCLRMRAHGARGDLAGVRSEYLSYDKVITNDPWGDATPSPKVVECRNLLLRANSPAD